MKRSTGSSVQQRVQCIQVIQELQEELKLLRIPYEKLNGEGLTGLSYSELASLDSMLNKGLQIVEKQTDKAYEDFATMQIVEMGVMGMEWSDRIEKEDLAYQALLSSRRLALMNRSRELRLSPQDSEQEHSHSLEELMLTIQSLKREKKRLMLWSQRMIGKEIGGLSYAELYVLGLDISRGAMKVLQEMSKLRHAAPVCE